MNATRPKSTATLIFRAFSDRTRLRILNLLQGGELCVGDLVTVLGVPQSTASRHLAYLRRAGLTVLKTDGRWNFYRLAKAATPAHKKLLECLSVCFVDVPEIKADARRLLEVRKTGGCCPTD